MMTFRAGFTVKVERNQQEWDVIIKRNDPVGGALCIAGFNDEGEAKRLARTLTTLLVATLDMAQEDGR